MIEFLLSTFYFLIFCLIISKTSFFKDENIPRFWFIGAFTLKVLTGVILTLIYTKYYTDRSTSDIFKYFDDSLVLFDAVKSNPKDFIQMLLGLDFNQNYFNTHYYQKMQFWTRIYEDGIVSDTHIIIRFNAFIQFFSFGYFNVHNVFINFVAFSGLTLLYKAFKPYLKNKEKLLFLVLFLIPSILFWGSGLLKEGIILLGFGLLLHAFFKALTKFKPIYIIVGLIGITLITFTKFYLLIALTVPVLGYALNTFLKFKNVFYGYCISIATFLLSINLLPLFNPKFSFVKKIANKQLNFSRFITSVETNSGFQIPELSNGLSLLKNIPNALLNTVIRPFLWECNSIFVFMSFIENLLVLLFIIVCVFYRRKINIPQKNVFYFSLIFTFILYSIIGLTTPVFGAIIRYKIPGLLFLIIAMLLILDIEKLRIKFPFLLKII